MTATKMWPALRPMPDPEMLERQKEKLMIIGNMKRGGYGWEDIQLELKRKNMPIPTDQIRNFVLRPRS